MTEASPGEQQDQILERKVEENHNYQKLRPSMIEESPGEQQDQILEEQMKENHSHQELRAPSCGSIWRVSAY